NAKFITAPAAAPQNAPTAIGAPPWTIRTSTETSTAVPTAPPRPEATSSRMLRTVRDGAAAMPEVGPLPSGFPDVATCQVFTRSACVDDTRVDNFVTWGRPWRGFSGLGVLGGLGGLGRRTARALAWNEQARGTVD